jgi:hypothetical protein
MRTPLALRFLLCGLLAAGLAFGAAAVDSLTAGKAELKSAGALSFGPEGILFVGDSAGATIFALDTGDRTASGAKPVNVTGIDQKIAAMLGASPDQILINDMAVNPISKKTYLSVSRGRGPDAAPVILRVDSAGKIEELPLANVKYSKIALPNAPAADAKDRRGASLRQEAITDLHYVNGRVFIAGLSNEEFASNLRSIPFPFSTPDKGASVEIYHGSHGRWETNSPVRTFVPYEIKTEPHLLAAYTCTPLVKFPVSQLKPGTKVVGTTIAELGNRNRPLDMVVYQRGGKNFLVMNNSSRGVMKMSLENVEAYEAITAPTELKGLPYETVASLKGVEQLDKLDDATALILVRGESGSLDLKSVPMP